MIKSTLLLSAIVLVGMKYELDQNIKFTYQARAQSAPARRASAEICAVTGRRNPHSGKGEDFLTGQLNFFTQTAVTPERKVEKLFPRWEINRHAKG